MPIHTVNGQVFFGTNACDSSDCAAQEAGFRWGKLNDVRDNDVCMKSKAEQFADGCMAAVASTLAEDDFSN